MDGLSDVFFLFFLIFLIWNEHKPCKIKRCKNQGKGNEFCNADTLHQENQIIEHTE